MNQPLAEHEMPKSLAVSLHHAAVLNRPRGLPCPQECGAVCQPGILALMMSLPLLRVYAHIATSAPQRIKVPLQDALVELIVILERGPHIDVEVVNNGTRSLMTKVQISNFACSR
jgi:hypothetical protein